ncbi:hypothetical protein DL95DRAFT_411718 [Leptodontidium sp. 2 PMI_412]|nr:hypothetical protein BKA61DRAFT_616215 [Leptodontidium sp. MPI-SDFR-AT-0119]KAH9211827.1 hypothetical protein DL95DRAFT_411718 [Leptodontidium sp. 2 PMI_412]
MADNPLRVVIRVCVTDIPGNKLARATRLAHDFSEQVRRRPFNNNLNAECHDSEHLLPNFDSDNAVRAWFLFDFDVKGPLTKGEVLALPHEVYHASRQGDAWVFIPRERWIDSARKYCSMYKWGANHLQQ